jgi:hypothetical protein
VAASAAERRALFAAESTAAAAVSCVRVRVRVAVAAIRPRAACCAAVAEAAGACARDGASKEMLRGGKQELDACTHRALWLRCASDACALSGALPPREPPWLYSPPPPPPPPRARVSAPEANTHA